MQGEHEKILRMVEEGTITAEEAQELFDAIDDYDVDAGISEETYDVPEQLGSRQLWQRPFGISTVTATIGAGLLIRTRRSQGLFALVRGIVLLPLTIIAILVAVVTYLSKDGPWLHIRVRSDEGERISLTLPFPLHIARGGLRVARSQISDDEVGEKIDMAAEFLEAVESSNLRDPLTIDVMDEGNSVQIFLG